MKKISLNELGFQSRNEALSFLKKLWRGEKTLCPLCGSELELLHKRQRKMIVTGSAELVIKQSGQSIC